MRHKHYSDSKHTARCGKNLDCGIPSIHRKYFVWFLWIILGSLGNVVVVLIFFLDALPMSHWCGSSGTASFRGSAELLHSFLCKFKQYNSAQSGVMIAPFKIAITVSTNSYTSTQMVWKMQFIIYFLFKFLILWRCPKCLHLPYGF